MKDNKPVIFYSWQSDHSKTRYFIETALRAAIENLAENPDIELAPRFDKDTQGKVGSINIPTTIRKKIDSADVFVAAAPDVPIAQPSDYPIYGDD